MSFYIRSGIPYIPTLIIVTCDCYCAPYGWVCNVYMQKTRIETPRLENEMLISIVTHLDGWQSETH